MATTSDNQSQAQLLREVSEDDDALLDSVVCSIINDDKGKLNNSDGGSVLELTVKPEFHQEMDMALNEDEPELANNEMNNDCQYWIDENGKYSRSRSSASDSSASSSSGSRTNWNKHFEYETDPAVLCRRQKDIDYGKNTVGYDRYIQQIPKQQRTKDHPRTPPMHLKYSRRGWDGMVKLWRKQLHYWDPPSEQIDNREKSDTTVGILRNFTLVITTIMDEKIKRQLKVGPL